MTHLLDTNACIHHLRNGPNSKVSQRLLASPADSICLCSVVVAELLYGARRSQQSAAALDKVREFCSPYMSLPFDDRAAEEYAEIRFSLSKIGTPIGPNDLMIAAIALANGITLVTHNTAEFSRVSRLAIEDWQR